jgi:intracellular septation protein
MNALLEWSPLIGFFVTFELFGIYWATGVLMLASVAVLFAHRLRTGSYKPMHVIVAVVACVLGTATLLLHDKRFIQWKPTVLFGVAAAVFLGSAAIGRRPLARGLLQSAFDEPMDVTDSAWRRLTVLWGLWFALLAGANVYVLQHFSEGAWVKFKIFGLPGALMIFMLPQAFWLAGRIKPKPVEQP